MTNIPASPTSSWTRLSHPLRPSSRRAQDIAASAAWRDGDELGARRVEYIGDLQLEAGGVLPSVTVAYQTWGTLNEAGDNAILVLHALTGDTHVTRNVDHRDPAVAASAAARASARSRDGLPPEDAPGWWEPMVGPGAPIDTTRYFVVAPNVLGGCQGTTGPASTAPDGRPYGSQFPVITIRDQVAAEVALTKLLGISQWRVVLGGSMGGLRALEWAIMGPEAGIDVGAAGVIAASSQTTGDQIAWAHPQIAAIEADPYFFGGDYYDQPAGFGPHRGLGIARQIAHTTYRSARELDRRFGRIPQHAEDPMFGGRFAVQSYLDHHGDKLARRFDANSYVVLTQAMLTHDIGRDRGGVATALRSISCPMLVVAVDSDRLFLPRESQRICAHAPGAEPLETIYSDYGHDGFLLEFDQLAPMIARFLRQLPAVRSPK